jgi:hypothetical protein
MSQQKAAQAGRILMLCVFLVTSMLASNSFALPIVSYSISSSDNNNGWILDFSVTNNLGAGNYIYFFGVELPNRAIVGSPTNWDPNVYTFYDISYDGGSGIYNYNNVWLNGKTEDRTDPSTNLISDGRTLSGFRVLDADSIAPTSVHWFAFAEFGNYSGGDNFHVNINPGFEGTVFQGIAKDPPIAAPEPSTFLLIIVGLAGIGFLRRRILIDHSK